MRDSRRRRPGKHEFFPQAARAPGSQIITALEQAWAAIRDQHPEIPDVVVVTGAGSNQKGMPEGYRLRGHHWPERWETGTADQRRMPELFVAGEMLASGARAVLEVMLHEATHALAVVRGIRGTDLGSEALGRIVIDLDDSTALQA
jgi:hypothetical protein